MRAAPFFIIITPWRAGWGSWSKALPGARLRSRRSQETRKSNRKSANAKSSASTGLAPRFLHRPPVTPRRGAHLCVCVRTRSRARLTLRLLSVCMCVFCACRHRFKICVSGLNSQNRYCGESVIVNLPHVDLPGHQIKHWPWEHVHALRDMIRRFHKIPLQQAAMDTAGLPGGGSGLVPTPKSKTPAPAHARKPRKKKNRPVDPRFAQGSRSASPRARNPSTSPRDKA